MPESLAGLPPCASCGKPTTRKCPRCIYAPPYGDEGGADINTYYCNRHCRDTDWNNHKEKCQTLQSRKRLFRAASLIQQIMFAVRRQASVHQFSRPVFVRGKDENTGAVALRDWGPSRDEYGVVPHPSCENEWGLSRDVWDGVMMHSGSDQAAMGLLESWIEPLFPQADFDVRESLMVVPVEQKLRVYGISSIGKLSPPQTFQSVYRVTIRKGGECWAVVPTAIQFGYRDPVVPYNELVDPRGRYKWGHYRTRQVWWDIGRWLAMLEPGMQELFDLFNTLPAMLAEEYGGEERELSAVLDSWEDIRKQLVDDVEEAVKGLVSKINSPEEKRRREERYEALSRGPDSPEYKEDVKRLEKRICERMEKVSPDKSPTERMAVLATTCENCRPGRLSTAEPDAQLGFVFAQMHESLEYRRIESRLEESLGIGGMTRTPSIYADVTRGFFPREGSLYSIFETGEARLSPWPGTCVALDN